MIPTYERRALVTEAVQSVLRQTYRSFEVLVVDDGSTDGTAEAVSALGGPVHCLRQENRGVAVARNAGIAAARGSIIAFLDSDNLWLPEHLETIVDAFDDFPEAVLACTSQHLGDRLPRGERARLVDPLPQQLISPWTRFITTVAIRAEILRQVEGFDESLPTSEDGDLCLRVALDGPFAVASRRTARIRATRGSLWQRSRASGAFLETDLQITRRFIREVERWPTPRQEVITAAQGRLSLNHAYRALAAKDDEAVRAALADACRAIPELSRDPEIVVRRLSVQVPGTGDARELAHTFTTAADLWPEPGSDTALVLRCCAVLQRLRARDGSEAVSLVRQLPLRDTVALAFRQRAMLARVAGTRIQRLSLRGKEAPTLSGGTVPR